MSASTLLVVSPHLDDAVLSCAGAILAHTSAGNRAVVATVFSEGSDGERRREEDRAALEVLHAEAMHLGLLDAPQRLGAARSHRALVEEAELAATDVSMARARLERVIKSVQPTRVLAPLGVGGHVDHRVVHAALVERPGVEFYEERPYAFLAGATRASFGMRPPAELALAPSSAEVQRDMEVLPHLRAYLGGADDGPRARAWLAARLVAHAAAHEEPARLTGVVTTYDEVTARRAVRAIMMYTSQVPDLFGGAEHIAPALRAAARALGTARAIGPAPWVHLAERLFVPA